MMSCGRIMDGSAGVVMEDEPCRWNVVRRTSGWWRGQVSWSFDTASQRLKEFCGLRISDQTLRRETEAAGKKVGIWQQTAAESVESFHQAQGWKEFYTDGSCVNTREGWREILDPAKVRDRPGGLGFVSAPWSARVRADDGEIGRA